MITVKEIHSYYNLVNFSGAPTIQQLLYPTCREDDWLILKIDDDDKPYFFNPFERSKIYPGQQFSDTVRSFLK